MSKSTDQIKLTQNQRDLSVLEDERKALLAEIEGLEPKLRHGDVWVNENGYTRTTFYQSSDTRVGRQDYNEYGIVPDSNPRTILYNNDLAALAEPLDEFEHDHTKASMVDGKLKLTTWRGPWYIADPEQFHRNLGRLLIQPKLDKAKK